LVKTRKYVQRVKKRRVNTSKMNGWMAFHRQIPRQAKTQTGTTLLHSAERRESEAMYQKSRLDV